MKKSKKIIILVILLVIAIIIGILVYVIYRYQYTHKIVYKDYTQENLDMTHDSVERYLEDKMPPANLAVLYTAYKGKGDLNTLYKKLYLFANYLPTVMSNIDTSSDEAIISYFNENNNDIIENMGISNETKFVNFIKYIKGTGYTSQAILRCSIDTDTISNGNARYFRFVSNFEVENFENGLKVKVSFSNGEEENIPVYYSPVED